MPLTSYTVDEKQVALIRLERERGAQRDQHRRCWRSCSSTSTGRRRTRRRGSLVISSNDHLGLSAGADVREELDEKGRVRRMELFAQLYDELTAFPKPTVAACHGSVVGGGAEIAVACDLRVGGSNLRMRFPGAELGVPVGPARLVTLCGLATAKYLLLTSRNVSADEALRMGLVHRVAPAAGTEDAALDLAAEVAAHPPEAVARLKQMLHRWDGVVERSADEGRGQVEWQRTGPGLPYRDRS